MKRVDELVISELVIEVESPNSAWAIPGRIQAQIQWKLLAHLRNEYFLKFIFYLIILKKRWIKLWKKNIFFIKKKFSDSWFFFLTTEQFLY